MTHPILKAVGKKQPVGMIHIDAHCDTCGSFDQTKFHHGGPFRNAVLDGVLDPGSLRRRRGRCQTRCCGWSMC